MGELENLNHVHVIRPDQRGGTTMRNISLTTGLSRVEILTQRGISKAAGRSSGVGMTEPQQFGCPRKIFGVY